MPRADLLALTADDLATLSNRGTVKRAQRELEAAGVSCEIREEGDLVVTWSDGTVCRFPAGKAIHDAVCTSGLGITRHVIRSVLAYQRTATSAPLPTGEVSSGDVTPAPGSVDRDNDGKAANGEEVSIQHEPRNRFAVAGGSRLDDSREVSGAWDPGAITDEQLIEQYRKPAIQQARQRFEEGVLVELSRGAKPVARFLDEGCTLRFLVPGDLRYVSADCAESLLPTRVPLAVWAFRELPTDRLAGLLSLQQTDLPAPTSLLASLAELLDELLVEGLSGIPQAWPQRLMRVEGALRDAGLVWPAELVSDVLLQVEAYRQHDARFEPAQVVQLIGELTARARAIAAPSSTVKEAVPQPLIRGTKADRPMDIAGGRLIGVGLGVRPGKRHVTLHVYLQDADTGSVVAVERTFADPADTSKDAPRSFVDLAGTMLYRGISLAGLASSQLLLKTGKRTASGQLILPRTATSLTLHPQTFQWEQLKAPFAAESFAQLAARFQTLPPSFLRPRRTTENLHAVPLSRVDQVHFDPARQEISARLIDRSPGDGNKARLVFPFHSRGQQGFNDLAALLTERGDAIRFVCGHFRTTTLGLEVQPVCVVVGDGPQRTAVLPWLARARQVEDAEVAGTQQSAGAFTAEQVGRPPLPHFLELLNDALANLVLTGTTRGDPEAWSELRRRGRELGFVRLIQPVDALAEFLASRRNSVRRDVASGLKPFRDLCLLTRLAAE